MTVIIFLIVLAVLIFVHELGHFLFARWSGIRVDEFKIGFGPRLLSWKRGETSYGLNLIPFGGYVKIFGENPDEENTHGPDKARSFVHKHRAKQVAVLAAGVLFNFIFAWILYVIVFGMGVTASKQDFSNYADRFTNERIMVTGVNTGSPAEKSGLKAGDSILAISAISASTSSSKLTVPDIQKAINDSKGSPLSLTFTRLENSEHISSTTTLVPVAGIVADRYAIGISMQEVGDLRVPFFAAFFEGGRYTLVMIRDTALGLYDFFAKIFIGQGNFQDVAGPVGIAGIVGDAASMGFKYLLLITALISINLGVINLIPFPALDGGRILFVLIEGITRRRIPAKFANIVNLVGFALLMALMVFVTYKDIARLF